MLVLLEDQTQDGPGVTGTPPSAQECPAVVYVVGSFDGATVHLEVSSDGESWKEVASYTAKPEEPPTVDVAGQAVRGRVSGAGEETRVSLILS